ncbi:hypothetical protein BDK51DRAFT_8597, partial [Blyttiomyces helicus]
LFVYPFTGKSGISIRLLDKERLNEGQFLNDTVIEFYLKYLMAEHVEESIRDDYHVFNSFFYEQLSHK